MQKVKGDIKCKDDIDRMVNTFYAKVNKDDLLSNVFNDFAKVDWDSHLPKMVGFWNSLIFSEQTYSGNPFDAHIPLPVKDDHFDRWLMLFEENMDEQFSGEVAEATKLRAKSIAYIFKTKLSHIRANQ